LQRPTNRRKLICDDDQLLERLKREVGDLADLNAQQAEALQQSEKFYRTVFDQSPVGLYIYDKEFKITHCNERMNQILGAFYERIVGLDTKKINDLSFMSAMRKFSKASFVMKSTSTRQATVQQGYGYL